MANAEIQMMTFVTCCMQTLMLYLLNSADRPPQGTPLISAPKLAVDDVLVSARLMTGSKSAQ
jgi:hypothetical protein